MNKLPRTYIYKKGLKRAKQIATFLQSDDLKNIIEELVAIELTDTFETSLNGFEWSLLGCDIKVKNIEWERN